MTEQASFSCRYHLTLEESKEGFALATFGKKKFTRYLTPLLSVGIIIWGFYLGWQSIGQVYIILGFSFLLLQLLMRFVILPKLFSRQYERYQYGQVEQGIDLYQDSAVLIAADRQHRFAYSDVVRLIKGKISYVIELKDKTVIILSKSAIEATGKQDVFESAFRKD